MIVDKLMSAQIHEALNDIEKSYGVKVLYACESGSRAWGFASPDSDYDVRFIYVHPPEWYLRVHEGTDNIDRPKYNELLDLQGWDIRKALGLFAKGNPTLFEWLKSPIVYRREGNEHALLTDLMTSWFSATKAYYHYYSMSKKNFEQHLRGDSVRLKKYFYVLRPILCTAWIKAGKGIPPMEFETLVNEMVSEPDVLEAITDLLARKRRAGEAEYGAPIPVLNAYLEAKLEEYKSADSLSSNVLLSGAIKQLDDLLYRTVLEKK